MKVQNIEKAKSYRDMKAKDRRCYSSWSKKKSMVIIRDNFCCRCCYKPFDLEIHHILPKRDYPHFSTEKSNLITLCKSCHKKADNGEITIENLLNKIV
jgi:5-methylcytosine-specific restriction endonuclease McrA